MKYIGREFCVKNKYIDVCLEYLKLFLDAHNENNAKVMATAETWFNNSEKLVIAAEVLPYARKNYEDMSQTLAKFVLIDTSDWSVDMNIKLENVKFSKFLNEPYLTESKLVYDEITRAFT
jgi:hypothetical protein